MLTFTKSMLALSVMAAVGGANAATYTEDTTLTDKIFTEGIMAIDGATVTVTGDEIAGKWFKATNHSQDVGSKYSYEQSKLLLGNADTKKITINNSSKDLVSGLIVSGPGTERPDFAGSQMFVTTKDLVMNLHSENSYAYGINAMNASTNRRDENSELIEGAKETVKLVSMLKTPSSMQQPAPISILRTRNIVPSASLRFRKLKLKSMAIYMSMPVPPLLPEVRLSLTSTKTKTPIPSSNSTATSISTTINQPVKPLFVLL